MAKDDSTRLPRVGSAEFKKLDFKDQLEIKSVQLFEPDRYRALIGEPVEQRPALRLPDSYSIVPTIVDLPVSVARNCWAAYMCNYNKKKYIPVSPVDLFGIAHERQLGAHLFTFPLLSLESAVQKFLFWLNEGQKTPPDMDRVLMACRMYIAYTESEFSGQVRLPAYAFKLIKRQAMSVELRTVEDLNGYMPIVEESEEIEYLRWNLMSLVPKAQVREGRTFYPLVPADLYKKSFSVYGWSFI